MSEEPKSGMVPFEEKMHADGIFMRKGIFVDGELFDWGIDEDEYNEAVKWANNQLTKEECLLKIHQSIEEHFVESLSEFIGRAVSIEEVQEARASGWIAK